MARFRTMILRFRDLATSPGQTIAAHQKIIQDNPTSPYTWWAWWNKIGEQVPSEAFRYLNKQIEKNAHVIAYLFDTGTLEFYQIKLKEIAWDINYKQIRSPEPKRTPTYYRKTPYLAWFKISKIVKIDQNKVLGKFSYVKVDELFLSHRSIFGTFYNKIVVSEEELRHQERTIWFVRTKKPQDSAREILLYDTGKVYPSNFPESWVTAKGINVLWLSDLHFSKDFHRFPIKAHDSPSKMTLIDRLHKELKTENISAPSAVLITGDLTWAGEEEEFRLVREFLGELQSRYSLADNQIVFCPGNHDLRFTKRPWEKGEEVEFAPEEATAHFVNFYREFYGVQPNEFLCSGRRLVLGDGVCIEVVSLNSSLLRQEPEVFQGQGMITEQQLDFVSSEMGWQKGPNTAPKPFRILMLHHHVVPILSETPKYGETLSTVYDAPDLIKWIAQYEINLVLHGHMHFISSKEENTINPEDEKINHHFTIVSMGSSGVIEDKISEQKYNSFSIIKFARNSASVDIFNIQPNAAVAAPKRSAHRVDVSY